MNPVSGRISEDSIFEFSKALYALCSSTREGFLPVSGIGSLRAGHARGRTVVPDYDRCVCYDDTRPATMHCDGRNAYVALGPACSRFMAGMKELGYECGLLVVENVSTEDGKFELRAGLSDGSGRNHFCIVIREGHAEFVF